MPEQQAERRVVRGRRYASDRVAGVDVLETDCRAALPEVILDRVSKISTDVAVLDVARRVARGGLGEEVLAGALGDDDHRVTTVVEPLSQRCQKLVEGERHLGHQAEIHLAVDQHGVGCDVSRVAPHQLHQADAVACGLSLGIGGIGGSARLGDRGLEPERSLHERHVVVDRLGNADHGELQATLRRFLADLLCAAQRAVAADGEENANAEVFEVIDHRGCILRSARGSEDRAAAFVNPSHRFRGQPQRFVADPGHQPLVTEAEAIDLPNAVVMVQAQDNGADDIIQPRAQAAAGHDSARQRRSIEEHHLPRAGGLHRRQFGRPLQPALCALEGGVIEHALVVPREPDSRHR